MKKQVAQRKSLFDDPADKIEELTGIIKMDIQAIKRKLQSMEALSNSQTGASQQSIEHSGMVVGTLSDNLRDTTMQFAQILELRTEVRHSNILTILINLTFFTTKKNTNLILFIKKATYLQC